MIRSLQLDSLRISVSTINGCLGRTRWSRQCLRIRSLSSVSSSSSRGIRKEPLRVAIVGGGVAGLSSALHLAQLVDKGLLASPIDLYTLQPNPHAREIGVGIWSTAMDPFKESSRESLQQVYQTLAKQGSWVGDVGYRTPNGSWLMRSHLPISETERSMLNMPGLVFVREKDLLSALRKATDWEQDHGGTVCIHQNANRMRVIGLQEDSSMPWSTKLVLENQILTSRDYHLIIVADGTNSLLRYHYGGHQDSSLNTRVLTGTGVMGSSMMETSSQHLSSNKDSLLAWNTMQQEEAVGLQDRNYTVFRGNSPLSSSQLLTEYSGNDNAASFQTWGMGKNMRFATVPMTFTATTTTRDHNDDLHKNHSERQVWFVTTNDDQITSESDPRKRQQLLLDGFADWHAPIRRLIETTPPEEILMERAVAHRYSVAPIVNVNQLLKKIRGKRPPNSGEGPCIVFIGDANMTVDPILAQGYTVAMEGAADLVPAIQAACECDGDVPFPDSNDVALGFHPHRLRILLRQRYTSRVHRIVCLLRATELVQILGQPAGGTVSGLLNTKLFRPLIQILPNAIKKTIFDAMLKYSLGLLYKR